MMLSKRKDVDADQITGMETIDLDDDEGILAHGARCRKPPVEAPMKSPQTMAMTQPTPDETRMKMPTMTMTTMTALRKADAAAKDDTHRIRGGR